MAASAGEGHVPPKELAAVMNSDEKLLWFDHPGAGAFAVTRLKSLMMSVPFFAFSYIWFNVFLKPDMPEYMGILGYVFIAFGTWHVLVPVWAFLVARLFMYYAITDKRLIILQFYPRKKLIPIELRDVVNILHIKGANKSGTLIIEVADLHNKKNTTEGQFVKAVGTFYGVRNAERVEAAINQLRSQIQGMGKPGGPPIKKKK
ncbi:MAG: hypothetical protein KAI73_01390 [Rhodospirillaceae bacterium]|nr:hypothetical protein [Rhodospirillaceae bacterium]